MRVKTRAFQETDSDFLCKLKDINVYNFIVSNRENISSSLFYCHIFIVSINAKFST